jgi:general secretion pathway protein G
MSGRSRRGFTLIELLVVIVIISLVAALLLPAILKAMCTARAGTAEHLIDQVGQAAKAYELDYAVYPAGKGDGTKELVYALRQKGPKKLSYFDFPPDNLDAAGNMINPVFPDGEPPTNIMYYRNNAVNTQAGGGGGGGGGGGQPPVYHKSSFDMWCAGCNYQAGAPNTTWSVNNWE